MTDTELIEFATEFRDGILEGRPSALMCAAVCWPMEALLNMSGVDCRSVSADFEDYNHVWIRLADGRVLDPTADQFNEHFGLALPAVYLGEPVKRLHRKNGA